MITEENKNLLFRDLSSRFSHGVKVAYTTLPDDMPKVWDVIGLPAVGLVDIIVPGKYRFAAVPVEEIKPYLRPMSSMTDEEKEDFGVCIHIQPKRYRGYTVNCSHYYTVSEIDWLNANHFDYRGLIEKGLALEAPEGMYKME